MHGYLSSSQSFAYQLSFFEKDFNVFCPDLKGCGKNQGMPYPYSLDDYINEVKAYMLGRGIICPHVVAHSFGCRIVLKAVAQQPNLFDKLVLTGAAGLKPKLTAKKFIKRTTFNFLKKFIPKQKLTAFYSSDYNQLSPVMKQSFNKIINENLDSYLPNVKNQTLLIFGDKDKQTPLYMAKRLNKGIINSTLSVYKGAGHFCFIDKSIKFNTEVREFLLSH